jgi:hypothetical protein
VDDRGRRIAQNEVVFREVNERLRELGKSFSVVGEPAEFVCECGDSGCTDRVQMPLSDYERVRSNPKWFLVVKGHEELDYEVVVKEEDGYVIVEKLPGGPAEIAISDDPRGEQR